jgi:hypothetical protein
MKKILCMAALLLLTTLGALGQQLQWTPLYQGVDLLKVNTRQPLALYAVRIDLKAPGIAFKVTPSNGDRPKDTDARKTGTFLRESGVQVAINASQFQPEEREGRPVDVTGLSVSNGKQYSPPAPGHAGLSISADNQVRLFTQPEEPMKPYNAVSGMDWVLKDGTAVPSKGPRHPRTAVGLSQDRKTLYLLVIDGRQGHSDGASVEETGQWLQRLGAWEGITLDGGGSSTLVIRGANGTPQVVNRPSDGGQRPVANHLGVRANPLRP